MLIADSWFGQVICALELFRRGLFCIMNVKSAHKGYPKNKIMPHVEEVKGSSAEKRAARHARRGKVVGFSKAFKVGAKEVRVTAAGHNKKVPLLLVATASSLIEGDDHVKRWRTTDAQGEQQLHELRTTQPEMHALYRKYMNLVDVHNKLRQGERSMADAWRTHSWKARHFAEMLGFVEVNIYKSLVFFKKGPWSKMNHNDFRKRLAHAFMTLGKEPFPDDLLGDTLSSSALASPEAVGYRDLGSVDSASGLFTGPSAAVHMYVSFYKEKREAHTCAYCGTLTTKYCATCLDIGRGHIAVCGRKSGRACVDEHAAGKPVKHATWKIGPRGAKGSADEQPAAKKTRRSVRASRQ